MKTIFKNLTLVSLFFLVAGCDFFSKRPDIIPTTPNTVMNYFEYTQYAWETPQRNIGMSGLFGVALVVADANPTFQTLVNPPMNGCLYSALDGFRNTLLGWKQYRGVNIGTMDLIGPNGAKAEIAPQGNNFIFGGYGFLESGSWQLQTTGFQGTMAIKQSFVIPQSIQNLRDNLHVSSGTFLEQPMTATPGDTIHLVKGQDYTLTLRQVPPEAKFARVEVNDNSSDPHGNVTCYLPINRTPDPNATPDQGPITKVTLPKETLNLMRTTPTDGTLFVDLVAPQVATNIPGVKESIVYVTTRHLHGFMEFTTKDQQGNPSKIDLRFGTLSIDDPGSTAQDAGATQGAATTPSSDPQDPPANSPTS